MPEATLRFNFVLEWDALVNWRVALNPLVLNRPQIARLNPHYSPILKFNRSKLGQMFVNIPQQLSWDPKTRLVSHLTMLRTDIVPAESSFSPTHDLYSLPTPPRLSPISPQTMAVFSI